MYGGRLFEPCVAIDAAPFVKPPLFKRGVGAHGYHVVAPEVDVGRHVVGLFGIAARLASQIEAVEKHPAVSENSVEAQRDASVGVGRVDGHNGAIPPDGGGGITVADGLVAVRVGGHRVVGQHPDEIVGQRDARPCRVGKLARVRPRVVYRVGLCQIVEILRSGPEVARRVGVAERKTPVGIIEVTLSRAPASGARAKSRAAI